jgi:hypothetical protein
VCAVRAEVVCSGREEPAIEAMVIITGGSDIREPAAAFTGSAEEARIRLATTRKRWPLFTSHTAADLAGLRGPLGARDACVRYGSQRRA